MAKPDMTPQMVASNPSNIIGIVAAIEDELMPTVQRLGLRRDGRWWRGKVGKHEVAAGLSGVGGERAVSLVEAIAQTHRPHAVYNIGFVGALTPQHTAGDVLVFGTVIQLTRQHETSRAHTLGRLSVSTSVFADTPAAHDAPQLLSSDHLVHDPAQKRGLAADTGAHAVDMESYALAEACIRLQIRLCIVRGVSDPVTMSLPEALPQWVKPDGRRNALRAATYLAIRPWQVPTVIRLAGNSSRAARAIAAHVAADLLR